MEWFKAAVLGLFGGGAAPAHVDQLQVQLEVAQVSPPALRWTVRNAGASPARFCRWHTPLEGIAADIFVVTGPSGAALPYLGVLAKRGAPTADDFLTLKAGESTSAVVELGADYGPLPAGPLTVRFVGTPGVNGLPDSAVVVIE